MQEQRGAEAFSFFSLWLTKAIAGLVLFFALVQAEFALALPAAGALFISFAADLWSRRAARGLSFSLAPDRDRVFPGENIELSIELRNMKFLPVWLTLELPLPRNLEAEEQLSEPGVLRGGLRLLSREKSRRVLRLRAKTRGVSRMGPARVSAGDLLGLSSRARSFAVTHEIIVFPRRLRMKTLNVPLQEYFGAHAARGPVEDPAWYAGTRDYTGTRPAKSIHWKASARLGTLQEKLCEPTLQRKLLFILDTRGWEEEAGEPENPAGNFERMIETLGTLAGALMETGASFGLVTNAGLENSFRRVLPAGRGPQHLGSLLEILARISGPCAAGFDDELRAEARRYAGFVYCGRSPGERALGVCREIAGHAGGRKKIFCVFDGEGARAAAFWEGFPACRSEDLCEAPQ
ncbi:MAG: DUF58 domain-containing protein [Spirochaetales bacterium]|jgi:uncharacterized protein (DUF58 family)|nr:DUF58 domain-containing protein [Spirochaetales bacterium]